MGYDYRVYEIWRPPEELSLEAYRAKQVEARTCPIEWLRHMTLKRYSDNQFYLDLLRSYRPPINLPPPTECGSIPNDYIQQWNDPPPYINRWRYTQSKHMGTRITQLRGMENCTIARETLDKIRKTIKGHISPTTIKRALKTLGLKKYLYHVHLIYYRLTKKHLAQLDENEVSELIRLFNNTLTPWFDFTKKLRNFLSYNYVLHRLLLLIGRDDLIVYVRLPKGRKTRQRHDAVWEHICSANNWDYTDG